jgi:hypothetical protein
MSIDARIAVESMGDTRLALRLKVAKFGEPVHRKRAAQKANAEAELGG